MVFTHTGRVGDFFYSLPIYSAWYKKHGEPVRIVVPKNFPVLEETKRFALMFPFIADFIVSNLEVEFIRGGLPYRFDPNDYGISCDKWINIGFREYPNKFITQYYAEEHGLEIDYDFKIDVPYNLILEEKFRHKIGFANASSYRDDSEILEKVLQKSEVDYYKFSTDSTFWYNLCVAKHCKYNIVSGSMMSVLLMFARIPFSVFAWQTPLDLYYKSPVNQFGKMFFNLQSPFHTIESSKEDIHHTLNLNTFI